ncbi:MAG: hypothetical protein PHI68_03840 [Candidatus Cloacimonetes bacterium]|nr:hypothetical protein [Candidatus Cloacimonadota bacterium]
MNHIISENLKYLTLGNPQAAAGLGVLPIFSSHPHLHHYLSLHKALQNEFILITEINEGGSVPTLKVSNMSKEAIFILDGEELMGAKQNRILNTSVLIPPETELLVPVSCTERGRWHYESSHFDKSENVMPSNLRSQKAARVAENLKANKSYNADQHKIWMDIDYLQNQHRIQSKSEAMADVYHELRLSLDELASQFPLLPGQTGIYVEQAGTFAGLDLVSLPEVWQDLHKKLIRSYLINTYLDGKKPKPVSEASFINLIEELQAAEFLPFKSVGWGDDLRLEHPERTGSILLWDEEVIHCAIYPRHVSNEEKPFRRSGRGEMIY